MKGLKHSPRRDIKWPDGVRLAVCLTFDFEAEEDTWFYHDAEAPIDFRDHGERQFDGRRGIWRVLRVLKEHQMRCTFFSCGATLENYPEAARQVKADGHELAGHAYHHEYFDKLSEEEEEDAFKRMFVAFERVVGERPRGFRSCSPSHRTHGFLAKFGVEYDSTFLDEDLPYLIDFEDGGSLLELPNGFGGDASHFGHPVGRARSSGRLGIPALVLSNWKRDFDLAYERGANRTELMLITLHPYHVGRPSRAKAMGDLIAHMKKHPNVWYPTAGELADWWLSQLQNEQEVAAAGTRGDGPSTVAERAA